MKATPEQRRLASAEMALKKRLEAKFAIHLRTMFEKMRHDFYQATLRGGVFNPLNYSTKWEATLNKHIEMVQSAFDKSVKNSQKAITGYEVKAMHDSVQFHLKKTLLEWRDDRAYKSAKKIIETTIKNVEEARSRAHTIMLHDEMPLDNGNISAITSNLLGRAFDTRISIISTMETQAASESTKLFEAFALSDVPPFFGDLRNIQGMPNTTKTWITMGDEKVRQGEFDHVEADGQEVKVDEPYIVSDEELMQPGDQSLGASDGNVYGCRCSSLYTID